jgi:hypothetical protein
LEANSFLWFTEEAQRVNPMTETMPPPKKNKNPSPVTVLLRMDGPTAAALNAFIMSQEVPPKRNPVVISALREFLAKRGHWPPPRT